MPPLPPLILDGEWNATAFFTELLQHNILAGILGFRLTEVSGPAGLRSILSDTLLTPNMIAVDDTSEGHVTLIPTPRKDMVKTIFISMKHAPLDMQARARCMAEQHELFRQILTVLIMESTRLRNSYVTLDHQVNLQEIDRYFAPGYACSHFTLHVTLPVDLRYRSSEWT